MCSTRVPSYLALLGGLCAAMLPGFGLVAAGAVQAMAQPAELPWNPQPDPDDVVMPMPCDQKIVLRRVVTQTGPEAVDARLDDRRILLGRVNDNTAYYDYYRQDFIAGHFSQGGSRFYLIGKYEITDLQYSSLMKEGCLGEPDLPAASVSWYDAVEFTRRLTAYIRKNAGPELAAAVGDNGAYVRLPTEAEWEFAARGGMVASPDEFRADRLPLRGDPAESIWYNDPQSAQGEAEAVGLLRPNPLELYDMHGNVAEMLIEPFRLNKAGRMHGMAGGFVAKGGSFRSDLNLTGSAARREHGYFRSDGLEEYSSADVGLRVVVARTALTEDTDAIREEWRRAGQPRGLTGQNPVDQLTALQGEITDLTLSRSIDEIKQSILAFSEGRNDAQLLLLDSLLLGGGRMVLEIRKRQKDIDSRTAMIQAGLPDDLARRLADDNAVDESAMADFNYFGFELLARIAAEFSPEEITDRLGRVSGELRGRALQDHGIAEAVEIGGKIAKLMAQGAATYDRQDVRQLATEGLR